MARGWISLHRSLLTSSVFDNEKTLKVWVWCLLKASHQGHDQIVGRQLVHLEPGQFVFGRRASSEELRMKPSTTWEQMKLLQRMGNIDINSNNKFSVVTIKKWHEYQVEKSEVQHQERQQSDNRATTERQQSDTNNNVNNDKNDNNGHSYSLKGMDHEERLKAIRARSAAALAEMDYHKK